MHKFSREFKLEVLYYHLSLFLELENPALLILFSRLLPNQEGFYCLFCVTGHCHDTMSYTLWFILKTLNLALCALDLRELVKENV